MSWNRILINTAMIVCLAAGVASAFVEKLMPNHPDEGGIPCNAIGAMLFFYIDPAGPSDGVLNSIIQREWVPTGWSTQDLADNEALLGLIAGAPTTDAKENVVHKVVFFCMLWELGVDEVNTPSKFRTRLGIPQAP